MLAAATLVALAGPYVALELSGRPDPGEALCAALGVWLAGCAYLASGALAGSIASSPTVAYLMAMVGWAVVLVGVRMVVDDGASHAVDSSDLAFHQAAIGAFRDAYARKIAAKSQARKNQEMI